MKLERAHDVNEQPCCTSFPRHEDKFYEISSRAGKQFYSSGPVTPFVVAIIATFRRPHELERLLKSITTGAPEICALVVVDNGSSSEVEQIVGQWRGVGTYLNPGKNLGCGGGLRLAGQTAWSLYNTRLTHLAVLDDDAVLAPGAITDILSGMSRARADLGCAMIVNARGHVSWVPGLKGHRGANIERQRLTPKRFISQFGNHPIQFSWAQGICLVATHNVIAKEGFHRDSFWVRGEDLEYSLRLTANSPGVWVPGAIVKHLPPADDIRHSNAEEYLKHCAMLQNVTYIAFRLRHGRRILWTVPSNVLRFLRTWGIRSARDAFLAFWRGTIQGYPAGEGPGTTFMKRSPSFS